MKIVKPYGRTEVQEGIGNTLTRVLIPNRSSSEELDLKTFVVSEPKIVIAQWVQIIDKIASKPFDGSPPTTEQRLFRHKLADASLLLMEEKGALPDPYNRKGRLIKQWWQRVHSYGECIDDSIDRNPKGRWYSRFSENNKVLDNDFEEIAKKIYEHLYIHAYKINKLSKNRSKGLIELRAGSIKNSVNSNGLLSIKNNKGWNENDLDVYVKAGNVAGKIAEKIQKQILQRKRIKNSIYGAELAEHVSIVFSCGPNQISIQDASKISPGLVELHNEIRRFYKSLGKRKKQKIHIYPKDMETLIARVEDQSRNRRVNSLIRNGKVIHYHASQHSDADSPENIFTKWPLEIVTSPYWNSAGQHEIKRKENIVRIWRVLIVFAARNIKKISDPRNVINGDILGAKETRMALENFEQIPFLENSRMLFGNYANDIENYSKEECKSILTSMIFAVRNLRHSTFHFKGYQGLINALEKSPSELHFAKKIWIEDSQTEKMLFNDILVSVKASHYLSDSELKKVIDANSLRKKEIELPRFSKLLKRVENAWLSNKYRIYLPKPVKNKDRNNSALQCQYVLLKSIYESGFCEWLSMQDSNRLNNWYQEAVIRANVEARRISGDDRMNSRINSLIKLSPEENISSLMILIDRLVAIENRVQRGFTNDPVQAYKNSIYLENLRCDIVAKGFEEYLKQNKLDFLVTLNNRSEKEDNSSVKFEKGDVDDHHQNTWIYNLYLILHLVPADIVSKLTHQYKKSQTLSNKEDENALLVLRVLELYLFTHDKKYAGNHLTERNSILNLDDANFASQNNDIQLWLLRAERELERFGFKDIIDEAYLDCPVRSDQLEYLNKLELNDNVPKAHQARDEIHALWIKQNHNISINEREYYHAAIKTIIEHRHLTNHVSGVDKLRLCRIVLRVLGRLVDYSGLWERDLYFVTLALIKNHNSSPRAIFNKNSQQNKLESGQIIAALRSLGNTPLESMFKKELRESFGFNIDKKGSRHTRIRNDIAHFNMLNQGKKTLNLTKCANDVRFLLRHDRKLCNAVPGSIIKILDEEGIILKWSYSQGQLCDPKISSKRIVHLGNKEITEEICSDDFLCALKKIIGAKLQ